MSDQPPAPPSAPFQGFYAVATAKSGERYPVKVINTGIGSITKKQAFKVREVIYSGMKGWSGGATTVYRLGNVHWVYEVQGNYKTDRGAFSAANAQK